MTTTALAIFLNGGSYISAHVLLNLLNELRKKDKFVACQTFYLFFATSLIKFINIGARMLDSVYHVVLKLIKNRIFGVKREDFVIFYATL